MNTFIQPLTPDQEIFRFVIDMKTFFVLIQEGYSDVQYGINAKASAVKTKYSSFLAGAVAVFYQYPYPEDILCKSTKSGENRDGGIAWSPQFATADIFKGDNLSSTHHQLKSNLNTVKKNLLNDITNDFPLKDKAAAACNAVFTEMYNTLQHCQKALSSFQNI